MGVNEVICAKVLRAMSGIHMCYRSVYYYYSVMILLGGGRGFSMFIPIYRPSSGNPYNSFLFSRMVMDLFFLEKAFSVIF